MRLKSIVDTSSVQALYIGRIALQAATFLGLAIILSIEDYGRIAILSAISVVALPWVFAGLDVVVIRLLAQSSLSRRNLVKAVKISGTSAAAVYLTAIIAALSLSDTGLVVVAAFFVAELMLLPLCALSAQVALGIQRNTLYASILTVPAIVRLFALLATFLADGDHFEVYVFAVASAALAASVTTTIAFLLPTLRTRMRDSRDTSRISLGEGLSYAAGVSARGVYTDADKLVLAAVMGPAAAAVYTVAYRLLSFAQAPAQAFAATYFPRLLAAKGDQGAERVIFRRLLRRSTAAGFVGLAATLFGAVVLLPWLLPKYSDSMAYAVALSVIAVPSAMNGAMADLVTALGRQRDRATAQVFVALLSPVLTWLLLVSLDVGIWGAVWATVACEFVLLSLFVAQARKLLGRWEARK